MPRRYFNQGAEIVIEDFNAMSSAIERGLYDRVFYEMLQRSQNAFFQDSLKVSFSSANQLIVKKGLGFQTDSSQSSPEGKIRPIYLATDSVQTISAPDSVNDRIDLVCVAASLVDELSAVRKYKDAISQVVSNQTLVVQKDWMADILLVEGTPAGSPVAPAVPSGYLKIAEVLIGAVTGIAGAGSITDTRSLMPLGGSIALNTVGFDRIPASSGESLDSIIAAIDAFLTSGHQTFTDLDDLSADPEAPSDGRQRMYVKGGVAYLQNSSGSKSPMGSGGGGGGGGANWQPVSGLGPIEDQEYDEKVWHFEQGQGQAITLWVKVPTSYISGRQIKMRVGHYSPGTTGAWLFQAKATLVRRNLDPIDTTVHNYNSTNGDVTNSVANQYQEVVYDLSSSLGAIGGFAVSPGDLLKIELKRSTPSGSEDTNDIRMIPSSTEVLFT